MTPTLGTRGAPIAPQRAVTWAPTQNSISLARSTGAVLFGAGFAEMYRLITRLGVDVAKPAVLLLVGFFILIAGAVAISLPLRTYTRAIAVVILIWFGISATEILRAVWVEEIAVGHLAKAHALPMLGGTLVGCATTAAVVSVVVYARRRYWPVHIPGTCRKCGYDLYGLLAPRCPECGCPFERGGVRSECEE